MPTYAYSCPECGHEFQKFHKMNVRTRPKCPECGTPAERKITGGAGLLFKGSGFYITDYKKGPAKADKGDKGDKSDKPAKADKSAEPGGAKKKPDAPKKGADS